MRTLRLLLPTLLLLLALPTAAPAHPHGDHHRRGRSSSATAAPPATAPSTRSRPTASPPSSAPTTSSPTSSAPRTACSSPATSRRSAAPPTSPTTSSPRRKTTKVIDGASVTGWFTDDFTLKELKTLRAKERLPDIRPNNTKYDGKFEIPTFQEVLDLRARLSRKLHRQIGVYPETKHPTYFRSIGLPLEPKLVSTLNRNGLNRKGAPVFVQSFEIGNLQALDHVLKVPLVQLLDEAGPAPGGRPEPAQLRRRWRRPPGLREIATYADGVGPWKNYIIPRNRRRLLGQADELRQGRAPGRPRRPPVHVPAREHVRPARAAVVVRPRRDRRPRLGDPPVLPGRRGRLLHRQRGLRRPGPLLASPLDAAGRAPRRLPAPVRAARR